jgi:dUTP pyrophosphatase
MEPGYPVLKYVLTSEYASHPIQSSELAAGFDIASAYNFTVPARGKSVAYTDLKIELPKNCYGRLAARSGLAKDFNIFLACDTIDNDYRGEIRVVLFNHSDLDFQVHTGDRIAQLICQPYISPVLRQVNELSESQRGSSGFGSTGR